MEWKKPHTNEYILHDSIYLKLKKKKPLWLKIMVTSREKEVSNDKEQGMGMLSQYWICSIFPRGWWSNISVYFHIIH